MFINENQISKVFNKIVADLDSNNWEKIEPGRQERWVTKHLVRPVVENSLNNIGESRLILSSDGEVQPKQINRFGMTFSPDLDVTFLNQRCISFEVKLLRDNDASGSITKAIGQSIMYHELGYSYSLCLLFDCRRKRNASLVEFVLEKQYSNNRVKLRIY